MSDQRRLGERK